jgi:hypothetical protein
MRKFIANLFSNRFGIVLAALNVCYFASRVDSSIERPLDMAFFCANYPAGVLVWLSLKGVEILFSKPPYTVGMILINIICVFFIALQWLFIAWVARTLAAKISRPKL